MSNRWSSYKKDHLLMENWRTHLKDNPQSSEKIEEFFGRKKKWADIASGEATGGSNAIRGTVYNDIIAEVTVAIANLIEKLGLEIDPQEIVKEFQDMITNQNFELSEAQGEDIHGGRAEYGDVLKFDLSKAPKLTEFFKELKAAEADDTLMKLAKAIVRAGFDEASVTAALTDGKGISGSAGAAHRGRAGATGVPAQSSGRSGGYDEPKKKAAAAAAAAEAGELMDGSRREGMENAVLEYGGQKTPSNVQIWTSTEVPKELEKTFHLVPAQVKEIAEGLLPELPAPAPAADAPAEEPEEPKVAAAAESLKRDMQRIIDEVVGAATSTKTPEPRKPQKITPPREKQAAKDPEKWKANPVQLIAKIVGLLKPPSQETAANAEDIAGYLKVGLESTGWFEFDETAPEKPDPEPEPEVDTYEVDNGLDFPSGDLSLDGTPQSWDTGPVPDLVVTGGEDEVPPEEEPTAHSDDEKVKANQDDYEYYVMENNPEVKKSQIELKKQLERVYNGDSFERDYMSFINKLGAIKAKAAPEEMRATSLEEISGKDLATKFQLKAHFIPSFQQMKTDGDPIMTALLKVKPRKGVARRKKDLQDSDIMNHLGNIWKAIRVNPGHATQKKAQPPTEEPLNENKCYDRWKTLAGIK